MFKEFDFLDVYPKSTENIEKSIFRKILRFEEVDSTNTVAGKIVDSGINAAGIVIVADRQTKGLGRKGRRWQSPGGGLWLSLILKAPNSNTLVNFALALAVANSLKKTLGIKTELKWPNDVLVNGKKICGILSVLKKEYVIGGIGVNVNNKLNSIPYSSVSEELGKKVDMYPLEKTLLDEIRGYYTLLQNNTEQLLKEIRNRCSTIGKTVKIVYNNDSTFIGEAIEIDDIGRLIVKNRKIRKVSAADCFYIQKG